MNRTRIFSVCSALLSALATSAVVYGCGDDDNGVTTQPDGGGGTDTGTQDTGPTKPNPPGLGAQIDRMGRPGINTAVNKTFADPTTVRGPAQNAYNANGTRSGWAGAFQNEIASNLAIYDGIDRNCGNQAFASADAGAQNSSALRYATLASVLADDRLWLDSANATCNQYLGVELNATGAVANTDCGGRALKYDVIDVTYTALGSTLTGTPVTDGVDAVPGKVNGTTFPYLAAPQ